MVSRKNSYLFIVYVCDNLNNQEEIDISDCDDISEVIPIMSSNFKMATGFALILFMLVCSSPSRLLADTTTAVTSVAEVVLPNGGRAAVYSESGDKIAFLSSSLHTPSDLWVMNTDGSSPQRLTRRGVTSFRWQKDGNSIQFSTSRRGFGEVMAVDLVGGNSKRVDKLPPNASVPIYSPDGSLYALVVAGAKQSSDLWIGTSDGERLEAVTNNIGVRSFFWSPDSRKIYYEAGKVYGIGIWEINLSTMTSKALLNKYVGTPVYSEKAELIAFPYPDQPGHFSIHTLKSDGTEVGVYAAPRLPGRSITWDANGKGAYYLGQDLVAKDSLPAEPEKTNSEKPSVLHNTGAPESKFERSGVTSLWHLDFASGVETRVTPPELHLNSFELSPDGLTVLASGVLTDSFSAEIFRIDVKTQLMTRLVQSRSSSWMSVASVDSSKIAFFTNQSGTDTLKIVNLAGEEQNLFPGIVQEGDTRFSWLPSRNGLVFFSSRGLAVFTEDGPIDFSTKKDHRTFLYADVSIQSDKILISSIPRYGQYPGLYLLEAGEKEFEQTDLRFPSAPEVAANFYLQPKWSFDEKWIAFSDREDIWVMKSDGTERKWITRYAEKNAEGVEKTSLATHPIWSVFGKMLCFTRTVYEDKGLVREIWIIQRDGSGAKMVYSEPIDSAFQWTQEEATNLPFFDVTDEHLIFTAMDNGQPNLFSADLSKLDSGEKKGWFGTILDKLNPLSAGTDNGHVQRLTETGAIYPILLPEEDLIVYTSLVGNNEQLWQMNSDGTDKKPFFIKPTSEVVESKTE